jgi:hypothetical protein
MILGTRGGRQGQSGACQGHGKQVPGRRLLDLRGYEDKANHHVEVCEMNLPVGLHETVDAVARDTITPALSVVPTLVPNPATRTSGFLVVEIPQSPDAPHMADSIYWGRCETGKIRLTDDQVERLILARSRQPERLREAMQATVACDPLPDRGPASHFYSRQCRPQAGPTCSRAIPATMPAG